MACGFFEHQSNGANVWGDQRGNGSWDVAAACYSRGSTPDHAYGAAAVTKIRTWKKRFAISERHGDVK